MLKAEAALTVFILNVVTMTQAIALHQIPEGASDSHQFDDGEYQLLLEEFSADHGRIVFYSMIDRQSRQRRLRVEFTRKNGVADEVHLSEAFVISKDDDAGELTFGSFVDERTGLWCLYDKCGKNFVMLIAQPEDNRQPRYGFWHPGIRVGWMRGLWVRYFKDIRGGHDELPYDELPSELEIVDAE